MEKFLFLTPEGNELLALKEWGQNEKHLKILATHQCG